MIEDAHWKSFQENSESGPQSKKAKVPEGYDDFGSSDLSNLSDDGMGSSVMSAIVFVVDVLADSPASVTGKPREEAPDEKAEVSTKQKRRATAPPAKVVPKKTKVGEPSDGVIRAAGKPMTRRSNRTTRSQNKDTTPCEVLTGKTTLSLKGITADPASSGAKTAVSANDETTGAATTSCVASSTRAPASDPTTDEALSQHASSLMVPAPPAAVPVPLVTDGPSSSPLDGANDIPNALASKDISSSVAASTPDSCTGANALTDPNVGEDIHSHHRDAEASGDDMMNPGSKRVPCLLKKGC
ncbi:hypothetical protein MPER_01677 [Moniliophthora perniciosa FA553]|nr:hypothetical protein MPER_01677 [Moniliophthora perniciosa FA553]